ncbi:histidine--tRNA ligase [Pinisolibacter aquiterrae]|uniref:histidine--tRNA ligase n=1 Tax=Pinisolibacter aquiterrae TaxID=2815579 RepID=UPI001C3C2914|nr:histidine--tRNA ligase [Pinisolibacter aquiterrae]MBV5266705.1 histidine--tRNA ligase [Pinisolibacter aquiterrae]MCC8234982.1 histidine--tRNA ligase [Pinisolibacter aquiterrae]
MATDQKLKARLPRGLADRGPADVAATETMLAKIRAVYELYGFEAVETPLMEYTDALGKFLPDQDRPNEGVFSLQDDDEQWMSLRYDLTAPLARFAAENWTRIPKPYRSYRVGWVFRNEKPGPGRFRQFMQFDADTVGAASVAADAEICMMMADAMEAVGLKRGQYVVKVNNRKVLDGVMEAIGLSGDEHAAKRLTVLRAIDKLDKIGPEGVRDLLGAGRLDQSGDFTKGAGLEAAAIDTVLAFTAARGETGAATIANLGALVGATVKGAEGVAELAEIATLVEASGYGDRVLIDPSVVRGLEYYTGPVYEAELTFEVPNEDGQIVRFGSVGGGGRYDGLVSRFLSEPAPATGFSIGVSRLMSALKAISSPILSGTEALGPVVVLVMDKDRAGDYLALTKRLRDAGIRAEMYLGSSGMKAQMKYADRRKAPCVIIQGSNEREAGVVQIKDLVAGAEAAKSIESNAEWKAARPAQVEVKVEDLVETVRGILASQA